MHRAGIDCIGRHRRTRRGPSREIAGRVSREFAPAAGRAEVVGVALMYVAVRCSVRIDRHAAYRINDSAGFRRTWAIMTAALMAAVIMIAVTMRVLVHGESSCCASIPSRGI